MSNIYCNFDIRGRLVYKVNCGMSELVQSAEYNFAYAFLGQEMKVCGVALFNECDIYGYNRHHRYTTTSCSP